MAILSLPIIHAELPKPIVVPTMKLTGFYACMLGLDYALLKNQRALGLTKQQLATAMTVMHTMVPLAVISPLSPNNVAFAAVPWFLATYSAYLPTEQFSLTEWVRALYATVVDHSPSSASPGWLKVVRGLTKLAVLLFGVEPLLPDMPDLMLQYPWLSTHSLGWTLLFGLKAYLVLGGVDVMAGLAQAITGWCMIDMFDSPFLATSPIDFWSNRWNRTVRNLLHSVVFIGNRTKQASNATRGLMTFVVSGVFHELIIWSVCRRVTLENLCFFTLQGLACFIQSKYLPKKQQPVTGWKRAVYVAAQLSFMTLTGRLFLAPFLRHRFTQVFPITH
ncbi:hypothetical protein K501DRAFT_230111, partial [Backusella circina FSU 941]